jgi:hypothetical protein
MLIYNFRLFAVSGGGSTLTIGKKLISGLRNATLCALVATSGCATAPEKVEAPKKSRWALDYELNVNDVNGDPMYLSVIFENREAHDAVAQAMYWDNLKRAEDEQDEIDFGSEAFLNDVVPIINSDLQDNRPFLYISEREADSFLEAAYFRRRNGIAPEYDSTSKSKKVSAKLREIVPE